MLLNEKYIAKCSHFGKAKSECEVHPSCEILWGEQFAGLRKNGLIDHYIVHSYFHVVLFPFELSQRNATDVYNDFMQRVMLDNLELELLKLDNKVRFILAVVNGEIIVNNRKKADLLIELKQKGFTPSFPNKAKTGGAAAEEEPLESEENDEDVENSKGGVKAGDYAYLLAMPIGTLTLEKVQELLAEKSKQENQVEELKKETPKSLWMKDLDAFLVALDVRDKTNSISLSFFLFFFFSCSHQACSYFPPTQCRNKISKMLQRQTMCRKG